MPLCNFCKDLRTEQREDPLVAVLGGGIAGLTAAHELVERGFSVDLFEGGDVVGGLAATQWHTSTRIFSDGGEAATLPGEHGFRAFYSFYRHLTDTMQRIPLDRRYEELAAQVTKPPGKLRPHAPPFSVADNLIPTYKVAVALEDDMFREIQYDRRQPRSVAAASYALGVWMVAMGFPSSDIVRLQMRLLQFMTSCRERRYRDLTTKSLLAYLGEGDLSPRFKERFANISRFLVAIDPSEGDALTQAMIMCRLLMDPVVSGESQRNVDRVLNGPTSERWLDPWESFLREQGVRFFFKQQLDRFLLNDAGHIVDARIQCQSEDCSRHRGYLLNGGDTAAVTAGPRPRAFPYRYFVSAISGDALARALSRSRGLLDADAAETANRASQEERLRAQAQAMPDRRPKVQVKGMRRPAYVARQALVDARRRAWLRNTRAEATVVTGDPDLRSWVRLVNRSFKKPLPTSRRAKNDGSRANYRPWMSGMQFYLSDAMTVLPGHIHFPDSKWALTAVCQSQFWGGDFYRRYGAKQVRSILSVDICEFHEEGELFGKTVLQCTNAEIAREVWHQMKEGLKAWDMVLPEIFEHGGNSKLRRPAQVTLNKASKRRRQALNPVPLPYLDHHIDDRIVFKPTTGKIDRKECKVEYFVPGVGSWAARPGPLPALDSWDQGYRVRLGSLVIVGSFAQTFTSINTMEAANESARHGVNALLAHYEDRFEGPKAQAGRPHYVRFERCTIWPLEADEPADLDFWKQVDRNLYWDDENNQPKDDPRHLFEILGVDNWLAALLPNYKLIDNASFSEDKLWDSDGWKRFEKGFGGLWDKLLTLGRFGSPYSSS